MKIRKKIYTTFISILAVIVAFFFYLSYRIENSTGTAVSPVLVKIESGENFIDVGKKLQDKGAVSSYIYFAYYIWKEDLNGDIIAGEYELSPGMKISEIAEAIKQGKTAPPHVVITFPEGWTIEEMSERLANNGFDGEEFLKISQNPSEDLIARFDFLKNLPPGSSLEGYLFPDTYFFFNDADAEDIILKMLKNFDLKLSDDLRNEINKEDYNVHEVVTLASIIENEVSSSADRKIVSGIFHTRLEIGMALQSDATVAYAIGGDKKIQHDANDISIDSPYNTYKYPGLPPGPVSNPGLSAIEAVIFPEDSNYLYFLNNPKTGKTFFSETFEQHVQNKANNGL